MERTNVREKKGDKPPDKSGLNFTMTRLSKSGKGNGQAAQGGQPEGGSPQGNRPTMTKENDMRKR